MSSTPSPPQPRVRGNDWRSLAPPSLAGWAPTLSVSVVVLATRAPGTLACVLGALAAQRYPAHLLEVVVVADDATGRGLPAVRPENTRRVPAEGPAGRAARWRLGASATEGEVLHWLEDDVVPDPDEVAALLRWHHVLDHAVVLGRPGTVDLEGPLTGTVLAEVASGPVGFSFAHLPTSPDPAQEKRLTRTEGLTREPATAFLAHDGVPASVGRGLYLDSGGMDPRLRGGEHLELGYRLAQQGAVFVPEPQARSWRLRAPATGSATGPSTGPATGSRRAAAGRPGRPSLADRVPTMRSWRTAGRCYTVPWVQVVLDTTVAGYDAVHHSVDAVLAGEVADVEVSLLGPWARLADGGGTPLSGPSPTADRDLRLLAAEYAGEPRVRLTDEVAATAFPAPFRLRLPVGWAPATDTLRRLVTEATRRDRGLVSVLLADGSVCRLERTSAVSRARRLALGDGRGVDPEVLDGLVDDVSGTWWLEGGEEGFTPVSSSPAQPGRPPAPRTEWVAATGPPAPPAADGVRAHPRAPVPAPDPVPRRRRPGLPRLARRRDTS